MNFLERLTNLCEASNFFNRDVKTEEVEGFAANGGQVVHAHGLLLDESQVAVHPHLPLRLRPHLVETRYLLVGCRRRTGLLRQWTRPRDCRDTK